MKNSRMQLGIAITAILMLCESAWAGPVGVSVPDGGSTTLLFVLGALGLGLARKFMR